MRSKKAGPGRPSLHQTFASGGRPFLPPRATPLRFFRQAFLQKKAVTPRRSALSAAWIYPFASPAPLLLCFAAPVQERATCCRSHPRAGRSSPPGRNRTRRTDFPQVPTRAVGTRIFCTLPALPRGGFCPAAYAGFSPGLFAKRPSSPRAAPTAGLAQQNRDNRKKAASVPETAFSGAKIPRSRIKVRSAGSRRQSVSASPPTHR